MSRLPPLLAAVLAVAGCAGTSPPTHFYTLQSGTGATPLARLPNLALGLGPITLPDTLDRPQIVTRDGSYRMRLGEFDRWAGDLKANLARLLAARLSARLGTERIFLRPWASYRRPARQVRIDLTRLDGSPGGKATMQGTWTLLDGDGRSQLRLEAFDLHEPVRGSGYLGLVAAYSRLGDRLADHIAERLAGKATR